MERELINSYLGYNSTIPVGSIELTYFPAHEQFHHNNSFLCAALVLGQSNMAAEQSVLIIIVVVPMEK
jgi:hypothetical protein